MPRPAHDETTKHGKTYTITSDEEIVAGLPVHEHLGITEENLLEICRTLWETDPVIEHRKNKIIDHEQSKVTIALQEAEHQKELARIEDEIAQLKAQLKGAESGKRIVQGAIRSCRFNTKVQNERIRRTHLDIVTRKKQLFLAEAHKRLRALGRRLRLTVGRAAGKSPNKFEVLNQNEDQVTP